MAIKLKPATVAIVKQNRFEINRLLNSSLFIDPHGSLPLLVYWIKSCSFLANEGVLQNATFPIVQSSGTGKTKLVGQLCKSSNGPSDHVFWTVHIVCREAQGMWQSPFVKTLHGILSELLKQDRFKEVLKMTTSSSDPLEVEEEQRNEGVDYIDDAAWYTLMGIIPESESGRVLEPGSQVQALEAQPMQEAQSVQPAIEAQPVQDTEHLPSLLPQTPEDELLDQLAGHVETLFLQLMITIDEYVKGEQILGPRFILTGPRNEETFYNIFRYAESDGDSDRIKAFCDHVQTRNVSQASIKALSAGLTNKQVVVIWDEARGLFSGQVVSRKNSLLYRAVRLASSRIVTEFVGTSRNGAFSFIVMDTNARVSNFQRPLDRDPSAGRSARAGEELKPSMPAFLHVDFFDVHAAELISGMLKEPRGIDRQATAFDDKDSEAAKLMKGIGRPLWHNLLEKSKTIDSLVKAVAYRINPARSEWHVGFDLNLPEGIAHVRKPPWLALLAMRFPSNIPMRAGLASQLVADSNATLTTVSGDCHLASIQYRAEPSLAAASAFLMKAPKVRKRVFEDLTEYVGRFGPEAGVGGEYVAMMMSCAAIDRLTLGAPYISVDFVRWLATFLGFDPDHPPAKFTKAIPKWCHGASICLSHYTTVDLGTPDWTAVELARIQGVGLVPASRQNPGYDFIIPFQTANGDCACLLVSMKNAKNKPTSKAKAKLAEQSGIWKAARNTFFQLRGKKPGNHPRILSLLLSLGHGRGMSDNWDEIDLVEQTITEDLKENMPLPPDGVLFGPCIADREDSFDFALAIINQMNVPDIKLTGSNTWESQSTFLSLLKSLEDNLSYHEREWNLHQRRTGMNASFSRYKMGLVDPLGWHLELLYRSLLVDLDSSKIDRVSKFALQLRVSAARKNTPAESKFICNLAARLGLFLRDKDIVKAEAVEPSSDRDVDDAGQRVRKEPVAKSRSRGVKRTATTGGSKLASTTRTRGAKREDQSNPILMKSICK